MSSQITYLFQEHSQRYKSKDLASCKQLTLQTKNNLKPTASGNTFSL